MSEKNKMCQRVSTKCMYVTKCRPTSWVEDRSEKQLVI